MYRHVALEAELSFIAVALLYNVVGIVCGRVAYASVAFKGALDVFAL